MKNTEIHAGDSRVAGIWIDHEKAYIVSLFRKRESILKIESGVKKHIRYTGESRIPAAPRGSKNVATDGRGGRTRRAELRGFYASVIENVRDAESVYVLGPGKAKEEFLKEAKRSREFVERIAAVETVRRMTRSQIAARARAYFAERGGFPELKNPRSRTHAKRAAMSDGTAAES